MNEMQMWQSLEGSTALVLEGNKNPIASLIRGDVPAVIIRGAFATEDCRKLVARFYKRNLVPGLPKPGELIEGRRDIERVDVGTSLGNIGDDRERFFAESEKTNQLFSDLFDGVANPIDCLYGVLSQLAPGKRAVTAYEPDGRRYGPAIFRCHLPHWSYPPHVDSVRRRNARTGYSAYRFSHQLAGLILLQPPEQDDSFLDSIIYRKEWDHEIAKKENQDFGELGNLDREAFHAYADEQRIARYGVRLGEGDMYFFKTENVHEVPGFSGNRPRIVMATFIGYSPEENEIFVWA